MTVAGAGAAYLSGGGLGTWELAFTAVLTYVAYRGLDSWTFIGVAWLLHHVGHRASRPGQPDHPVRA